MTKKEYTAELQKHGPKELAASYVFPAAITSKKKKEADLALNEVLTKRRAAMSDEDKLKAVLLQLRFEIEDYLKDPAFNKNKSFGFFLEKYISSLNKMRHQFAHEIDITPAALSQYVNSHRNPPQDIIIRLELHSKNNIPATIWYRLLEKETIYYLDTNSALRTKQRKHIIKRASLV